MKILVINAGSSSLKYQLIDMDKDEVLAKGLCERIGIDGSKLKHTPAGKDDVIIMQPMKNHADAIKLVIGALTDKEHGVISSMEEIGAVGHRTVHGGEVFSESVVVTDDVIAAMEECVPLAPLHNPANLTGIAACSEVMPGTPQVAVFDTAFHQTMPKKAFMYAIPYEMYQKHKIRKYGFHGTSHQYVAGRAANLLGKPISELKIVTCHLGNGSSITGIDGGKSIDTSMGFTPLDGVPMGTRCGSIDPAIVTFLMENEGLSAKEVDAMLNKQSGVFGISGVSSDFRDIEQKADEGNERAQLALDAFMNSVTKYIGAFAAEMGGVDAIVFTAGIGENNGKMRKEICAPLAFLGACIDDEKNAVRGKEIDVSKDGAKVRVLVIPTNDELAIAKETQRLVEK